MERPSFLPNGRLRSFSNYFYNEDKLLLPLPGHPKAKVRVRALLGHCLYRRVILWTVAVIVILGLALTSSGGQRRRERLLAFVEHYQGGDSAGGKGDNGQPNVVFVVTTGSEKSGSSVWGINQPSWLRFRQ